MRISYIITPFRSSEYLVRCINSALRQTLSDNEIIIAENDFEISKEISDYLSTNNQIKCITNKPQTDFEKIAEAVKSVQDNSLVKFIDVDTVAVPVASAEVEKCASDIVLTAVAVKNEKDYDIEMSNGRSTFQNSFIKKEILDNMPQKVFEDPFLFELWMDKIISSGIEYKTTDTVCFYIQNKLYKSSRGTAQQYLNEKEDLFFILDNSLRSGTKTGQILFDKYLSLLYKLMCSAQYDTQVKTDIFEIIKEVARRIGANDTAQRMFLLYFGAGTEEIAKMDAEAYMFYSQRVLTLSDKAVVTARLEQIVEDAAEPIRKSLSSIEEIKLKQEEEFKKTQAMSEEIDKLKNDIAALTKNMHFVFNSASAGGETEAFTEPLQQIPAMFAQGKLGLKVIIKSFKAWLKYKLSVRKK